LTYRLTSVSFFFERCENSVFVNQNPWLDVSDRFIHL